MIIQYYLDSSLVDSTWETVLISERDAAGQIPVNFVTRPSLSLTEACFTNGVYELNSAVLCMSNLLTVGYRRFVVDVYWSTEQRQWSLCPVAIASNSETSRATTIQPSEPSLVTELKAVTTTNKSRPSDISAKSQATITAAGDNAGSSLYQLGRYSCDPHLGLSTLFDLLGSYFRKTASPLHAYTTYVVFNLHAASNSSHPNQPAPILSRSKLPTGSERLGTQVNAALGRFLYTPSMLVDDRSNLNRSWFSVSEGNQPITEYFTIQSDAKGDLSTPDGWPCEKYVLLGKQRRILLQFGSIDLQMQGYDVKDDGRKIFPQGFLASDARISTSVNGTLQSGCFYRPKVTGVSGVNSSWAQTSILPLSGKSKNSSFVQILQRVSYFVQNLTACGISPMLDSSLFNSTAVNSIDSYRNVSFSSTWAWAVGEPQGASARLYIDRCAVVDLTASGHWRAINCTENRLAACRVGNSPFSWTLSTQVTNYWDASNRCPANSTFALPRNGLENTYLYHRLLAQSKDLINPASVNASKYEVWLDFNSLHTESCWVTGGPAAPCPYVASPQQLHRRTVLVATIAGIVICIIAALTFFVKCNAARRTPRKRRRRVIEGWDYEGVPS